jgi:hypothetical protein
VKARIDGGKGIRRTVWIRPLALGAGEQNIFNFKNDNKKYGNSV